jgi:putative tryptophan/tyrosine transport system substrate-binding protein
MRRRNFLRLFAGVAAIYPLSTRAQQADRVRRIGVLIGLAADGAEGQAALTVLVQALQQSG